MFSRFSGISNIRARAAGRAGTTLVAATVVMLMSASALTGALVDHLGPGDPSGDLSGDPSGERPGVGPDAPPPSQRALDVVAAAARTVVAASARPVSTSALTSTAPRVLVAAPERPTRPGAVLRVDLPRGITTAAVSVSVRDAVRPGTVSLRAAGSWVDAVRVAAAGATATNTVLVPVHRRLLEIRAGSGGGLVVELVGSFTRARTARAGRFVPVGPVRVAHLVTVRDGREGTIDASSYGAGPGLTAALVMVTAQTGPSPSWLELGSTAGRVDQTVRWSPLAGRPIQRRGLALVDVGADGRFSFRYEHGAVVDLDVVGYFTGPGARSSVAGLWVPHRQRTVFDGLVNPGGARVRGPADASTVFVNLAAAPGVTGPLDPRDVGIASGRTIGTVLDGSGGVIKLGASRALQTRVDLLGYFAAGRRAG